MKILNQDFLDMKKASPSALDCPVGSIPQEI
jgi:hypothetical protein